jgi:phosphonate transport system substrate-binding protein
MIDRRHFLAAAGSLLAGPGAPAVRGAEAAGGESGKIRIALSGAMLGDVNENDARAAIRAWADVITKQTGLDVEYDRNMLVDPLSLQNAVRRHLVDAFAITVPEYMPVASVIDPTSLMIDEFSSAGGHEYVLLAHRAKGLHDVAGIKGRTLVIHKSPYTCLAPCWLDTLTADVSPAGFVPFLGPVSYQVKLSKAVLPVYFQQLDLCVIQQRGFRMMCELNPQLAKDLQVVARSPKLIPAMMAFHRQCPSARRDSFRTALLNFHQSAAGKQALTLFQSGKLVQSDHTVLRSAIEILTASERIRARAHRKRG